MAQQPQPLDLDAIEARANAATPGPWFNDSHEIYAGENTDIPAMSEWIGETCDPRRPDHGAANAEFVAAARTDVPALVAEIRRLTADVDMWRRTVTRTEQGRARAIADNDRLATELQQARAALHSVESDADRASRKGYDLDAEDIRATAHNALNPAAVSGA